MAKIEKKVVKATAEPIRLSADKIKKALEHASIAHPHAEYIYINAKGEHHLHPRPGFLRIDVNSGEASAEPVAKVKASKVQVEDGEPEAPKDNMEF